MRKIFKSIATVTIIGFVTKILGFFYRIVLSRNLDSLALGRYQMTIGVFCVFLTLTGSGLPLSISRLTAKETSPLKQNQIAFSGVLISGFLGLIATLFILIFKAPIKMLFPDPLCYSLLLFLAPSLVFESVHTALRGSLWGKQDFFHYSLIECLEEGFSLFAIIALFYFIKPNFQMVYYPEIAITFSILLATVVSLFFYFRNSRLSYEKSYTTKIIQVAKPITAVRLLSSFTGSILSLILPSRLVAFGHTKAAAISLLGLVSGVAMPLLFAPTSVISSLSVVLLPELSKNAKDKKATFESVKKSFTFACIISSMLVPIYLIFGENICHLIFGKAECGDLVKFASFSVLPICLNQLSVAVLNSLGGEKYSFSNFLIGVTIAIGFVIFLTPFISIYANLLSIYLQSTIIFALNLGRISKILEIKRGDLAKTLTYVFSIAPSILLAILLKTIITFENPIVNLSLSLLLIFGFQILSMLLLFYKTTKKHLISFAFNWLMK